MKGGLRSNNIDPNARLCMASAVVGFYQTFGVDEPANCYADIEKADLFLLWGNNMAEAHPVLWSRVANRRLTHQATRIVQLTTHRSSTSNLSDLVIIFKPNTDLAILNFVIREIIHRGKVNQEFVDAHCIFCAGVTDIGYGLRQTDKYAWPAEKDIMPSSFPSNSINGKPLARAVRKAKLFRKRIPVQLLANIGALVLRISRKALNLTRSTLLLNLPKAITLSLLLISRKNSWNSPTMSAMTAVTS